MPRPTTKNELETAAQLSFDRLVKLWDGLTVDQSHRPFPTELFVKGPQSHWRRDQCLRDLVIHLYEWHQLLLRWVTAHQAGIPANFFPEPYTWRDYAGLNEQFVHDHRETSYETARCLLASSHDQILDMIARFSNEELFTKKYFHWTGSTSLGSYFVSATTSHYEWALKKTRTYLRILSHSQD